MKFVDLVFISLFLIALLTGSQMLGIDSDLGRHLALGNYILDQHSIPTRDIFSHTLTGQSRPPYEWLSQVAFAVIDRLLGLDGVILLTASLIGFTFLLLFQNSNLRSNSPLIALIMVFLSAAAASIHWLPRPHIVTNLMLVIWISKLEQLRRGEKTRLYLFPFIMLFWANLHGGFIFGFLAWGAYLAGWLWDRWRNKADNQTGKNFILAGILSLVASMITPDLWRNWEAVLNNRSAFILSRTSETIPPILTDPSVYPFTLLLILTLLLFAINRKSLSASHLFLNAGLGVMALVMARNIPLFAVASAPILSGLLQKSLVRSEAWQRIAHRFDGFGKAEVRYGIVLATILLTALFFGVHRVRSGVAYFQFNPHIFPVEAVDWLEDHPQQGNMFNEFNWGGYLLYRLWPQSEVFLDSQSDFYGEPLMREYESMMLAQGNWNDLIDKYQVDWVIIPPDVPLASELKANGWTPAYEDKTAVILVEQYIGAYNTASIIKARKMNTK